MSKGKHKRQQVRRNAQQEAANLALPNTVTATKEAPEPARGQANHKEGIAMGFREFLKRPSVTDWCVAGFTFVLALSAIYQFIIMGGQLDVMRTDQRAWLQFQASPTKPGSDGATWQLTSGQPVTYPLRVVNTGKTPAKNLDMKIFIDIVPADQEPPLEYVDKNSGHPYGHITSGIVFPNADFNQTVVRPSADGSPQLAIKDGKSYLAVYGVIDYDDVFKTHRRTKFCAWIATSGTFHASGCTKYNSVDTN